MKLLLTVVHSDDRDQVEKTLCNERIKSLRIASVNSFFGMVGVSTLLIPAEDKQVDKVLSLLKDAAGVHRSQIGDGSVSYAPSTSGLATVEEGGGCVFVIDVDQFVTF